MLQQCCHYFYPTLVLALHEGQRPTEIDNEAKRARKIIEKGLKRCAMEKWEHSRNHNCPVLQLLFSESQFKHMKPRNHTDQHGARTRVQISLQV
jgi:hypothetical protein